MSLPLCLLGNPILNKVTDPVLTFDTDLRTLIRDLRDSMIREGGMGFAAPQGGISLSVFVWDVPNPFKRKDYRGYIINPKLIFPDVNKYITVEEEGCLSIPGKRFDKKRFNMAKLLGQDLSGNVVGISAIGILARVFQHEFDHLNGLLICN